MYSGAYGRVSPSMHPGGRHFSRSTHHTSRFSRPRAGRQTHSRSFDHLPYVQSRRYYDPPKYRDRSDSPERWQHSLAHSRNRSTESLRWSSPKVHLPTVLPTSTKADLGRGYPHLRTKTGDPPMFKQFQYPTKVPTTPDRIHRGTIKWGKVNSTVNDSDMRPSYQSHKNSKRLSPEPLSESEEEVLYRAEEEDWERISEPPSIEDESCYISASEGEQEAGHSMLGPYQLVEEEHYRSNLTSRSGSRSSSVASNRAREEDPPRHRSRKKSKAKRKQQPSEGELSPLHEEEEERSKKKRQKAQAPLSFPKPKKRPSPRAHTRYVTQPILFPVPQPYPMPFPMYSPMTPMYYPPQPASQSMEVPRIDPIVQSKKATCTQFTQASPEAVQTEPTGPQSTSAFLEALAEMDRRLGPPPVHSVAEARALRKPVALGIGLTADKSLAEHFQQKLPQVSAKLHSRDSSRTRQTHAEKSSAQLLEIRRDLLRPASANSRLSNASGASDPRLESASMRSIDPAQLERADRLAAGMSVVPSKKPTSERFVSGSETPLSCITEETQDRRGRRAPVKIQ